LKFREGQSDLASKAGIPQPVYGTTPPQGGIPPQGVAQPTPSPLVSVGDVKVEEDDEQVTIKISKSSLQALKDSGIKIID